MRNEEEDTFSVEDNEEKRKLVASCRRRLEERGVKIAVTIN